MACAGCNCRRPPDIEEVVAEKLKIVNQMTINRYLAERHEVRESWDHERDLMIRRMTAYVLAMPKERIQISRRWPRTWWDAVKLRFAPRWFLRRWPAEFDQIEIDEPRYGPICPHIDAPQSHHVRFLQYGNAECQKPYCSP